MGIVYCSGSCGVLGLWGYWAGSSGASQGRSWSGSAFPLKEHVLCSLPRRRRQAHRSTLRGGPRLFSGKTRLLGAGVWAEASQDSSHGSGHGWGEVLVCSPGAGAARCSFPGLERVSCGDGEVGKQAGIVPAASSRCPPPKKSAHAAVQRGYPGGRRVAGLSQKRAGCSSHLAEALLSLPQDIRAGHWIFHPVLPNDVAGRAVLGQAPGGLALHHPDRR